MPNKFGKYQCPCCRYYTFDQKVGNTFDICAVCFWEDDGIQLNDPDFEGGANTVSLNQAKDNFKTYKACEERFINNVRKPYDDEL